MNIGRIHYLIPDIFRRSLSGRALLKSLRDGHAIDYLRNGLFPKHQPVGEIKIMYQHKIMALAGDRDIDFQVVDGLSQAELLSEYQSADVFLATGYPEGFSLPPLEAMSCGCAVVGFSGRGGLEFMHHRKTALVAQDGDCEAAAQLLLELLRDHALREELRSNGLQMAQRYSLARMRNELKGFFSSFA